MEIKAANNNLVFVKADAPVTKTSDGIFIAEEWKTLPPTGTVIAAGKDVTFVSVGDRVFFERFSAIPTPFGDDVRACREEGILATIK